MRAIRRFFWNAVMGALAIASCLAFVACAPTMKEKEFERPKTDFSPRFDDVDVQGDGPEAVFDFNRIASMDGTYSPAVLHRITENLIAIGRESGQPEMNEVAQRLWGKIQDLPMTRNSVAMKNSPFAELAISQTEGSVRSELELVDHQIREGIAPIQLSLKSVSEKHKWPAGPQDADVAAGAIGEYLSKFSEEISKKEIYGPLKEALTLELAKQKEWVLGLGKKLAEAVAHLKSLGDLIQVLQDTIDQEKIEVPDALKTTLIQGHEIAKGLENCNSAQGALAVIVDVWSLLDEAQRETFIKPVNKDLYKLLHGKSKRDLQCLKDKNCGGVLRDLMKSLFILPKLEEYGVAKICGELNDQSLQFSIRTLREMTPALFQEVPTLTEEAVLKALQEKRQQLSDIKDNYAGFFQEKYQTWSAGNLPGVGSTYGFNTGRVRVTLRNREMRMTMVKESVTSAEAMGAGLSASAQLLRTGLVTEHGQQIAIDSVNQLLSLSGYFDRNKNLIPALLMPLEPSAPLLDVTQFTASQDSYAVMDKVTMGPDFKALSPRPEAVNISALQQAELLRGISQQIAFFKDWRPTIFESTLGLIKAQQLVPDFEAAALERPVFPKSDLLALSIADAAVILKNITKKFSAVFVVGLNNQITWVSDYDFNGGDTAVMAGVVDIVDGRRSALVKSEDVSRWIMALAEFLKATEGIEKTKSEILLSVGSDGKRALETLLDARRQLRLLLIGMANFLSNEMVDKDGLVMKSMKLSDMQSEKDESKSVLDQALTIRALLAAAEATKIDVYQVSAIEVYYKMNFHLYNPKIRFYSVAQQSQVMPLPIAMEIVRAMTELKKHLPPVSQKQLAWILEPWFLGLKTLF